MTRAKLFIAWLGVLCMLAGCQDAVNPTSPGLSAQKAAKIVSDDVAGSDILENPFKTYRIVAVGDSITYGSGASVSYPSLLAAQLRNAGYRVNVTNEGIPGATSSMIDSYFMWLTADADIVLIMIGANDVTSDSSGTISHIRSMVDKSLRAGIIPILGTITPKSSSGSLAWANPVIISVNSEITALALEYNLKLADTYTAILTNGGETLFSGAHHFNDQGHNVIATEFYNRLIEVVFTPLPAKS